MTNKNRRRAAKCLHCGEGFESSANRVVYCSLRCRFLSQVIVLGADECWPWIGVKDRDGYGRFRFDYVMRRSNRVAFELFNGPLLDKLALHSCDNPECCNPQHLWAGTDGDNMRDRDAKGRGRFNPNAGDNGRSSRRDQLGRFAKGRSNV